MQVFLSVGSKLRADQEAFVSALEDRLRSVEVEPRTLGRTYYDNDRPFVAVNRLMDRCDGMIVIATERTRFEGGLERPDSPHEAALGPTRFCTPWNQIEAALAYARGLPMLEAPARIEALGSAEFSGVLASWLAKLKERASDPRISQKRAIDPEKKTVAQLVGAMRPGQLYALLGTSAAGLAAAFAAGAGLAP